MYGLKREGILQTLIGLIRNGPIAGFIPSFPTMLRIRANLHPKTLAKRDPRQHFPHQFSQLLNALATAADAGKEVAS